MSSDIFSPLVFTPEAMAPLIEYQHPAAVLERAWLLLCVPENWTTGALARDKRDDVFGFMRSPDPHSKLLLPHDPRAVCWDLEGAVARCANSWGIMPAFFCQLFDRLILQADDGQFTDELGGAMNGPLYNDQAGHAAVLALLARAVDELRGGNHGG